LKAICTVEEKPFCAGMEMWMGELVLPCAMVMELAESAMEKSGEGGDGWTPPVPPPPPQAVVCSTMASEEWRAFKEDVPF
jgi:hypothetical protein